MKILYVNHTATISGAERSLLSLLGALPDSVQPLLATPPGALRTAVEDLGIPTTRIAATAGSLRMHPLHTPRALVEMGVASVQVRRAAHRDAVALVHANSIRAGIVLALGRLAPVATVVHVRDCLSRGRVSDATMRMITHAATTVVANSRYTARSVCAAAPGARVEVVYNPVDLVRWDPAQIDRTRARERLGTTIASRLLLGVVAQLTPWKGQDTAIEALKLLCDQGIDAHLLLIGSAKFLARATRFDNAQYVAGLQRLVADYGLEDRVSWLGEREDVPELVRALDILLLPSWEEPFGRAVIEAMALETPVIATSVGGPPEIIEHGREGLLLAPREPSLWADAVGRLAHDPERRAEMGRAGRRCVERRFSVAHHLTAMLEVYEHAIARAG